MKFFKRYLLLLPLLLFISSVAARAQQAPDPCESPAVTKLTAVINIASATTTSLIAPGATANTVIFVCSATFSVSGTTTPTVTFEYGTGATCGTGTTAMTGAFIGGSTSAPTPYYMGPLQATPAASRVCALTGGTAPSVQGTIEYVPQG